MAVMPIEGPHPLFHGKEVRIDFSPFIRKRSVVAAQVYGLVLRLEDTGASEEELIAAIYDRLTDHPDLVARLVAQTDEAIEFLVAYG
jgi:hypothetical protein